MTAGFEHFRKSLDILVSDFRNCLIFCNSMWHFRKSQMWTFFGFETGTWYNPSTHFFFLHHLLCLFFLNFSHYRPVPHALLAGNLLLSSSHLWRGEASILLHLELVRGVSFPSQFTPHHLPVHMPVVLNLFCTWLYYCASEVTFPSAMRIILVGVISLTHNLVLLSGFLNNYHLLLRFSFRLFNPQIFYRWDLWPKLCIVINESIIRISVIPRHTSLSLLVTDFYLKLFGHVQSTILSPL